MKIATFFRKSVSVFLEYDTPKIVHIKSKGIGIVNRLLQLIIISYIVGFAIVYKKGYQETETVESVVTTKVKGTLFTNLSSTELEMSPHLASLYQRIWDPPDYTIPTSGGEQGGFFITTNVLITPNQTRGVCAEEPSIDGSDCKTDNDCMEGETLEVGNGVMTGKCVNSRNVTVKTCEIHAWCPVEVNHQPFHGKRGLLEGSKNFTVLIKNAIRFPKFGNQYIRRNILESTNKTYLQKCIYDPTTDPFCPVFRLGDIVRNSGENYSEVAKKGGVFQINIGWDCNLDFDFMQYCKPKYSFQRMDSPNALISPGWNFRTAEYHEENRRTLFKNFGIKFLVHVEGEAGKFNAVPLMINVGSGLAILGLATILCDLLVLYCTKNRDYYKAKKFLQVRSPNSYDVNPGESNDGQYSRFKTGQEGTGSGNGNPPNVAEDDSD